MRRLRLAIRAVDWAGFDGCERELSLSIGGNATETEEWSRIILRVGGKMHLRDQASGERWAKKRKVDLARGPGIVGIFPGVRGRTNGDKTVAAVLVGESAAFAGEIRIEGRVVLIIFVEVAAGGIGLPDFNEGAANGPAIFIHNAAAHFNAFAERLAFVLAR